MRSRIATALGVLLASVAWAGCGPDEDATERAASPAPPPTIGERGTSADAAKSLGFPHFATKNTTRVGGADPVADAAAVALAVYPSLTSESRPDAVTLVDRENWRAAISAAQLTGSPVGAPILFADGDELPDASAEALDRLDPKGSRIADGAQVIRIGVEARPEGLKDTNLEGSSGPELARAIDRLHTSIVGEPSRSVIVAPADDPAFALPAAGWAAKSGDPVLWAGRDSLPAATVAAIKAREKPHIYVLGPSKVISDAVLKQLDELGTAKRIGGETPVTNSIEFARYSDRGFGWNVVDPGHGLVFAAADRTLDAAAAAPLSASGSYGPLLVTDQGERLPGELSGYLLDIRPGYDADPVRGVYNHGWLIGDRTVLSLTLQAQIDSLLEIQQVDTSS